MKNIPMGGMPPEHARRKQFYSTSGATFQWNLALRTKSRPESVENRHGGEESRYSGTRLATMTGHREAHSDGWGGKKIEGLLLTASGS